MPPQPAQVPAPADASEPLPDVTLEVRPAGGRPVPYALGHVDFLIGTVPGCDLRVAGTELPAVVCLLARRPGSVTLRRLAPTLALLLNGKPASLATLNDGDRLTVGSTEVIVRVRQTAALPKSADPAEVEKARAGLQDATVRLRAEVVQFQKDKTDFERDRAQQTEAAQDQSRQFDARAKELDDDQARWVHRRQELDSELAELSQKVVEQRRLVDETHRTAHESLASRQQELDERTQVVEVRERRCEADVVRLHRLLGDVEQRDKTLTERSRDLEERETRLRDTSAEMEHQAEQLDEWRTRLTAEDERLARQKVEQNALAGQLAQRTAAAEGQQATLTALRTRMERAREELRTQAQQLDEQRAMQDTDRLDLDRRQQEIDRVTAELENDRQVHAQERRQFAERSAVLESAVRQMRQTQDTLGGEGARLKQLAADLEARSAEVADKDGLLQGRLTQLVEAQERVDAERQSLRERSAAIAQAEQAREALQEQLRRRSEELAARQKALAEQTDELERRAVTLAEERVRLHAEHADAEQRLAASQADVDRRAAEIEQRQAEMAGIEEKYQRQLEQLAQQRRAISDERAQFQHDQLAALERHAAARAEFEQMRQEARGLADQLPEVELRATTALDRLQHGRDQLRDHLAEVHQYVRQCHEDLEQVRARVQTDVERMQAQEQALRRGQDEHRLAAVAFRQQLIEWQGQVGEMKRLLAQDETRLERRQAQVEEKVREVDAASQQLARQAEELEEQQRAVDDRRDEIDRHLADMREWYRHKLRDLAGVPLAVADEPPVPTADADALVPITRGILNLSSPADQGDRQLGELLRELQLVDGATLTALLAEARRQRRSLRQVLLASGAVTLYQLALIEAGNLTALMLGPVRVIDRLRTTPHEAVYRVFDPRRGAEAVLRHLAESELADPLHPDEFRQRFGQAVLTDPHLANTLEVLEINGRPAALQEWLTGLPATDWPPLAAAPGVCCRLLTQAALALAAAHQAGLVHGHLDDGCLLLTADGTLKVGGVGEPPWLSGGDEEADVRTDLRALGKIASGWCTPSGVRRGAKARPLPEALVSVLYRLAADGDAGYADAAALLDDLEQAANAIPPNAEAWDRLLRYVRDHGTPDAALRRSA